MHCKRKHHSLLQLTSQESLPNFTSEQMFKLWANTYSKPIYNYNQPKMDQVQVTFSAGSETILLRLALVVIEHQGDLFRIRVLIDPGSQRTLVYKKI